MATLDVQLTPRPLLLALVAVAAVLAGSFVGATTNAVTGLVAPREFAQAVHQAENDEGYRRGVVQGALNGFLVGILVSLPCTVAVGVITDACCSFWFVFKHLLGVVAFVYLSWVLGGAAGIALQALGLRVSAASLSGEWVRGSILGAQMGCLFCTVVGLAILRVNWRHKIGRIGARSEAEP